MPAVLSGQNIVRANHVQQICNVFQMMSPEGAMHASVHQANLESVQVCVGEKKTCEMCVKLFHILKYLQKPCMQDITLGGLGGAGHSSLSFSGNSYIKYRLSDQLQSELKVSLKIRTLQSQGIIMYTQMEPCMVLKVCLC